MSQTTGAPGSWTGRRRLAGAAALGLFLMIQGAATFGLPRQPYPAIVMPAFKSASDPQGRFPVERLTVTVVTHLGDERNIAAPELMKDFRFSASTASIKYMFDPNGGAVKSNTVPESVRTWLQGRAVELTGTPARSITFKWCPKFVQVSDASESPNGECRQMVVDL